MICALIQDDIVVECPIDLNDIDIQEYAKRYQSVFSIENLDPIPKVGWHKIGNKLLDPDMSGNGGVIYITREGFISRFTDAELVALEVFMDVGPSPYKYYVRALDKRLTRTTYVDRSRSSVIAGMQLLVTLAILTSARRDEIMNAPAKLEEIYRGK
jgi:hypothetical protein